MPINATDLNRGMVNKKLKEDYNRKWFFNQFIGGAEQNPTTQQWILSGSPIERFDDFKTMATGNYVDVTMLKNLYGYGLDGEAQAQGQGRKMEFYTHRQYVHFKRNVFRLPSIVQAQKIDWMEIAKMNQPYMSRWAGGYMNADTVAALLEGYSRHLTAPANENGLGIDKQYHPNFWVWDGGNDDFVTNTPAYSYTTATYKAAIIAKLGGLLAADVLDTDTLNALPAMVSYANIMPFIVDGEEVFPLIINSRQEASLKSDSAFYSTVAQGQVRGKDNPMFNSASYQWGKFVIYVDDVVTRIAYATGTTLDFFDYSAGAYAENANKTLGIYEKVQLPGTNQRACCALLLGASALGYAPFLDWEFPEAESQDFGMVKELAIQSFYGLSRLDFRNNDTIASATETAAPQSAIVVTWAA